MSPTGTLSPPWTARVAPLHHAFQPIVDLRTGRCFGYEALLRGHAEAGFASIQAVFDDAFDAGVLPQLESALWARAIARFAELRHCGAVNLFCNVDNRGAFTLPAHRAAIVGQLAAAGLPPASLFLEISERHHLGTCAAPELLASLGRDGLRLAIDDLGCGYADLDLLRDWPSDIIKIDRSLVTDLDADAPKRLMMRAIVTLAHRLGRPVIAEGIETVAELEICRELGCDFGQGYLIQRPTTVLDELAPGYGHVVGRRVGGEAAPLPRAAYGLR